jgi:hypothetical protein
MRDSPNFQRSLMTESIAADTAGKLALSPKPTAIGTAKVPDKPDSAVKTSPDASKPTPESLTPSSGGSGRLSFGALRSKKQATIIASAVFSLIAGIAGFRLLWPATDESKTAQTATQSLVGDNKQTPASTATPPAPPDPTKPQSGTNAPTGIPTPSIPASGTTPTPVAPVGGGFNASKPQAHYMLTEQVITALRNAYVPETVLIKLTFLKNKELSQEEMEKDIAKVLLQDEKERYQPHIVEYSKMPEIIVPPQMPSPAISPSSFVSPAALPVPSLTPVQNSSATPPAYNQPLMPAAPLAPPSVSSTPPYGVTPNVGPGANLVKSPAENASPSANIVIPSPALGNLPSPNLPSPTVEVQLPQPVMPSVPERPTHDQFTREGSHGHPNTNSQSGTQLPALPNIPVMQSQPTGYVPYNQSQVVPVGAQETPKGTGSQTMPPANPVLPALPGTTPTSPAATQLPMPNAGLTSPGGIPLPSPTVSLPSPYLPSPTGVQGTTPTASGTPMETVPTAPRHPGTTINPTANSGSGVGGSGNTIQSTRPPSSPPPTPNAVSERAPTTSYDVDLYEPKQGDTWESISREFYNDTRYAAALKAVNLNKPLTSGGSVEIPPLYILKQKYQTPARSGTTTSQTAPVSSPAPAWGPPANPTTPATPAGGSQIYRVPAGGTSERDLAKNFLGNEQRWQEIFNLNPQITRPDAIPAGTEVRLPLDARLP